MNAGGAERMAVNYANALSTKIEFSGLIATRKEGGLKEKLNINVDYLFLQKKRSFDLLSIFRLRKYLVKNHIEIVHAHSSSFFIAVLVKLTLPKLKIVWHDHYGKRANELAKENKVLIFLSIFFSSILVVNFRLKEWSQKYMKCSNIHFMPNFTSINCHYSSSTKLKGIKCKRIVFLANLKNPKNHILILKAFSDLKLNELDWSLHLIGKDYFDDYSQALKDYIKLNLLENHIFLYGERNDVEHILSQADLGVLSSTEEGFPVTILEYGLQALPVVSTNAGYCSFVVKNEINGLLFNPSSVKEASEQILKMTKNVEFREKMGKNLKQFVVENYSEDVVVEKLISVYQLNY
ncbi:glycosyltransferase family 4 protein [Flavobacterium sp. 3-210]